MSNQEGSYRKSFGFLNTVINCFKFTPKLLFQLKLAGLEDVFLGKSVFVCTPHAPWLVY